MKEPTAPRKKTIPMRVVSHETMTADQESKFTEAIDALLAELVRTLDRRNEGFTYGEAEEQMAG